MARFGLYSSRVLFDGELREATITINGDKIEFVEWGRARHNDMPVENHGDAVIMPGLIDSHVHINEPGRTEWEGFDTATRAAALGGITTLIDMPLNSNPVTITPAALEQKIKAAEMNLHVNCGFYGGVIPGNEKEISGLINAGVFGIKAFLVHSGIDEFPYVTEEELRTILPELARSGVPLLVHAELESDHKGLEGLDQQPTNYQAYLNSRPKSWEDSAINKMLKLCQEFKNRLHIVHLSSSNSIATLREAIATGLPVSVETCPHYLFFNAETIRDGNTLLKCAPPIREKSNNDLLWNAIKDELISLIVTDHSPVPVELKELKSGNFKKAWGGIAGIQFSLPAVWTKGRERGFTIPQISNLMSSNVAKFLGLSSKGRIEKGYDADLIIWHPEKEFTVTSDMIAFRHKITPYEGQRMQGVVDQTYIGGEKVVDNGVVKSLNKGKILKRQA